MQIIDAGDCRDKQYAGGNAMFFVKASVDCGVGRICPAGCIRDLRGSSDYRHRYLHPKDWE